MQIQLASDAAEPVAEAIPGATANAYTPETETVGTTYYYAIVQGTTACVTISNIAQVTVKLALEATITPNTDHKQSVKEKK